MAHGRHGALILSVLDLPSFLAPSVVRARCPLSANSGHGVGTMMAAPQFCSSLSIPLVQKIRQATGAIQMGNRLVGLLIIGAGFGGFMGAGWITIPILVGVILVVSILSKLPELTNLPPHADKSAVNLTLSFLAAISVTTVIGSVLVVIAFLLGRGISALF